ncbi:3-hydroxy-3-methylglutaryl-coenzyme A reductase-like [Argonauta hians]
MLTLSRSMNTASLLLQSVFRAYGKFCALHPWEVIVGTLSVTLCLMSMTMYSSEVKMCGWNYACSNMDKMQSFSTIGIKIARYVAVMSLYLKFRDLKKIGSHYLLAVSALFALFSSLLFSIAVLNLVKSDLTDFNEAFPCLVLLIDLSSASTLACFAMGSSSPFEVQENIAQGMSQLGPVITLDAIVQTLVFGVGTLSGWKQLETISQFACLSVLANYLALMTFYPACLALMLELCHGVKNPEQSLCKFNLLTNKDGDEDQKLNPVIQVVKIIMSAGLVFVHVYSRWITDSVKDADTMLYQNILPASDIKHKIQPEISFWQFYLGRLLTADYVTTLLLIVLLGLKYIFFDVAIDNSVNSLLKEDRKKSEISTQTSVEPTPPPPATQTTTTTTSLQPIKSPSQPIKSTTETVECHQVKKPTEGIGALSNQEIVDLVKKKRLAGYQLEKVLGDFERGVDVRRELINENFSDKTLIDKLPFKNYDYSAVYGACCENVIGYVPIPVGIVGPLSMNSKEYFVPMATTEGCLVASTNRGCSALKKSGGVRSFLLGDGMTRGPVVRFKSAEECMRLKMWLNKKESFQFVRDRFNETSRFANLTSLQTSQAGKYLFIRFVASTGDAMGMNMLSKGVEKAVAAIKDKFPDMEIISVSGNYCTDKKCAAINWVNGRGKTVVSEAVIPAKVVQDVLKTSVPALVDLNIAKNLIGSAMAGAQGGFNAHAANIVTAIYIATGQDAAENVSSSSCITLMETSGENNCDLYISCTMPSLELGTVGGGTRLPPQAACLKMLGVEGASDVPGTNAKTLAQIICSTVLAGELSLMSALAAGHLVKSHMQHNRAPTEKVKCSL